MAASYPPRPILCYPAPMFRALLAITGNTLTESLRQPLFLALTLAGIFLLLISPQLSTYSLDATISGDNRMLVELGLGNVWMVGMLLACFTATGILVREIEEKSVLTVISKPVPRPVLLLGKFLGCALAISTACATLGLTLLLLLRHRVMQNAFDTYDWPVIAFGVGFGVAAVAIAVLANFLHRKPFASTCSLALCAAALLAFACILVINKQWRFQSPATEFASHVGETSTSMREAAIGLLFVLQGVWIMTAAAIALSTRLGQVGTLILCLLAFLLGVGLAPVSEHVSAILGLDRITPAGQAIAHIWQARLPAGTKFFDLLVKGLTLVVPNLQLHWPADALSRGSSLVHDANGHFSLGYLGRVSLYSFLKITGILALGAVAFQKREVS